MSDEQLQKQYKSEGPCSHDIFPLVAGSRAQAAETIETLKKMISSGGVRVYRSLEGESGPSPALEAGDIMVTPLDHDLQEGERVKLAAKITGPEEMVLKHFRVFPKTAAKKTILRIPPFTQRIIQASFVRILTKQNEYFNTSPIETDVTIPTPAIGMASGAKRLITGADMQSIRTRVTRYVEVGKPFKFQFTKNHPLFKVEFFFEAGVHTATRDNLELVEYPFSAYDIVRIMYNAYPDKENTLTKDEQKEARKDLLDIQALLFTPTEMFGAARRKFFDLLVELGIFVAGQSFWTGTNVLDVFQEAMGIDIDRDLMEGGKHELARKQAMYKDESEKVMAAQQDLDGLTALIKTTGAMDEFVQWSDRNWKYFLLEAPTKEEPPVEPQNPVEARAENSA